MKTVYDLHRFWTSMSAIFGFTFHIGRMTEVRTPDIYIYIESSLSEGGSVGLGFQHTPVNIPCVRKPELFEKTYDVRCVASCVRSENCTLDFRGERRLL